MSEIKKIKERLEDISNENKIFVRMSADLAVQIRYLLRKKNIPFQALVDKLKMPEESVRTMLGGLHNLNLNTLAKIEDVVGEPIFWVPYLLEDYATVEMLEEKIKELEELKVKLENESNNKNQIDKTKTKEWIPYIMEI